MNPQGYKNGDKERTDGDNRMETKEGGMNKKIKVILTICLISTLLIIAYQLTTNKPTKIYTHDELKNLPEKELYEVFINNGLKVDKELQKYLTEEQIAEMLKKEFDSLIQGYPQRSHSMYLRFAKEVKRVYELLVSTDGS